MAMAKDKEEERPGPEKYTKEERLILNECERESFFLRALPLSCGAIAGVQYLVRTGKLARHPKYGALPKTLIAGGFAYILGKVSYFGECRKKILERIPDSNMAMVLKRGHRQPDMSSRPDVFPKNVPDRNTEEDNSTGLEYPADPRSFEGLNDSQRPSMDNEVKPPDNPEEKKTITYDELRRRNRDEYNSKLSQPQPPSQPGSPSYKDSPYMPQKTWPDRKSPPSQEPPSSVDPSIQAPAKRKRTNMWGDVIED